MRGQHKGQNGKVLIIGGSEDFVGAPALAGLAALRSGCDLVVIAAPEKTAYAINALSADLITKKLAGSYLTRAHVPILEKISEDFDCVLIGPGLGQNKETIQAVKMLCANIKQPKVIDADALKAKPLLNKCVVTPHAKEFQILFAKKPTKANAKKVANKNCVVLLKGKIDVITNGTKLIENKTGNDGMTIGGTGDVLAGVCSGLIAQGKTRFKAASEAAHLTGLVGDIIFEEMGYGFLASDLLELIPLIKK